MMKEDLSGVGKKADILLLDKNLTLKTVIKDGVTI